MDPFTVAAIGSTIYSGVKGAMDGKKAGQMDKKQLEQAEYDYNMRAPLRRQGMQALGQIEAPIDMGGLGYNASNPFAAARGPMKSTATMGDWGRMTTDADTIDNAIVGIRPDEFEFADDALGATYAGKSGGKQRFTGASGKQYTNDDRNHAQTQIREKAATRGGFAGIPPRTGVQPLTAKRAPASNRFSGIAPLGEEL